MRVLLRFRHYLKPYTRSILTGLLAALVVAISTAAIAGLIKPMFNDVFYRGARPEQWAEGLEGGHPWPPPTPVDQWRLEAQDRLLRAARDLSGYDPSRAYLTIPLLFLLAFVAKGLFTYLSSFRLGTVGLKVVKDVRAELYERIQGQSLRFFSAHPTGLLIARVTSDVTLLQEVVGSQMAELIRMSFSLVFLFAVALLLDWRLSLICTVVIPATLYPVFRFARTIKRSTHTSQSRLADLADRLQETIIGRRVVRGFNTEAFEIARFKAVLKRMLAADRLAMRYRSLTAPTIEMVGALAMSLLAGFAGWRIHAGTLDPGDLVATLAALYWIYAILKRFARFSNDLTRAAASAERVFKVIDLGRDILESPDAVRMPAFRREICFRQAHFSYVGEPVLVGVDLTIRKGEKVALVGASGAGKTTLVNLVPRFYDVTAGSVEIDGVDVRHLTLRSLRAQIGLVTQDVVLFNDTVSNNISYGSPGVHKDAVRAAARASQADEFIRALPQGYDTILGESAETLSTGQRQRIAIARALLKGASILILDEATSALDPASESLVQKALDALMRDRTAIIIAHRPATILSADRIVVLEGGRITEVGTHSQLLAKNGAYDRLYRTQFTGEEVRPSLSLEPGERQVH